MKLFREIGADGLHIEEVYTREDIISPQTYKEFVFPFNDRFINFARKLGLKTVLYVCGDVVPRLDQIGKLLPDALAFEESKKGFIVSNGSPFPLETEPSRIETMVKTAHNHRCQ